MNTEDFLLTMIAITVALYGYIHYGREIPRRTLRPRPFTWLIWGVLSTCVAMIQLKHGAGLGAIGAVLGAGSGYILAGMAWYYGHRRIHGTDIISLVLAFGLFLLWGSIGDTATVIAATAIYCIGFAPTVVRAWKAPRHERITPFLTATIKYGVSIMLLGNVSVVTAVYPVALTAANLGFVVLVLLRRRGCAIRK